MDTDTTPESTEPTTLAPVATDASAETEEPAGPKIVVRFRMGFGRKQRYLPIDTAPETLKSMVDGLKLAGARHIRAYRSEPIDLKSL